MWASDSQHDDVVDTLLEHDADVDIQDVSSSHDHLKLYRIIISCSHKNGHVSYSPVEEVTWVL